MKLRARLHSHLVARVKEHLPDALGTAWNSNEGGLVVAIESLKFNPSGTGDENGWLEAASFEGVCRAEIRADNIDGLEIEPLLADLSLTPITIEPIANHGEASVQGRARLIELRDSISDFGVATVLRFEVAGRLIKRIETVDTPSIYAARHGDEHQRIA